MEEAPSGARRRRVRRRDLLRARAPSDRDDGDSKPGEPKRRDSKPGAKKKEDARAGGGVSEADGDETNGATKETKPPWRKPDLKPERGPTPATPTKRSALKSGAESPETLKPGTTPRRRDASTTRARLQPRLRRLKRRKRVLARRLLRRRWLRPSARPPPRRRITRLPRSARRMTTRSSWRR